MCTVHFALYTLHIVLYALCSLRLLCHLVSVVLTATWSTPNCWYSSATVFVKGTFSVHRIFNLCQTWSNNYLDTSWESDLAYVLGRAFASLPLSTEKRTKVLLVGRIALVLFYCGELHFRTWAIPALSDEVALGHSSKRKSRGFWALPEFCHAILANFFTMCDGKI